MPGRIDEIDAGFDHPRATIAARTLPPGRHHVGTFDLGSKIGDQALADRLDQFGGRVKEWNLDPDCEEVKALMVELGPRRLRDWVIALSLYSLVQADEGNFLHRIAGLLGRNLL